MKNRSAILLVGPRPDGSIPSRDEQKALREVSEAIARAIRTVIKREAREQRSRRADSSQCAPDRGARGIVRRGPPPAASGRERLKRAVMNGQSIN